MARLAEEFINNIKPKLIDKFKYKNLHQVPKITKIVLNMGIGEAKEDEKILDKADLCFLGNFIFHIIRCANTEINKSNIIQKKYRTSTSCNNIIYASVHKVNSKALIISCQFS